MAKKEGEFIEFNDQEVFAKVISKRTEGFDDAIKEIDYEDAKEKRMSYDQIELEKKADSMNTTRQKNKFASEIKNGLGSRIKENPKAIRVTKKDRGLFDIIKDFFKKF